MFPNEVTVDQFGPAYIHVCTHRFECAQCVKIWNCWPTISLSHSLAIYFWLNFNALCNWDFTKFIAFFTATHAFFIWDNFLIAHCHSSRAIRPKSCSKLLCPKIHEWSGEIGNLREFYYGRKGYDDLEHQGISP